MNIVDIYNLTYKGTQNITSHYPITLPTSEYSLVKISYNDTGRSTIKGKYVGQNPEDPIEMVLSDMDMSDQMQGDGSYTDRLQSYKQDITDNDIKVFMVDMASTIFYYYIMTQQTMAFHPLTVHFPLPVDEKVLDQNVFAYVNYSVEIFDNMFIKSLGKSWMTQLKHFHTAWGSLFKKEIDMSTYIPSIAFDSVAGYAKYLSFQLQDMGKHFKEVSSLIVDGKDYLVTVKDESIKEILTGKNELLESIGSGQAKIESLVDQSHGRIESLVDQSHENVRHIVEDGKDYIEEMISKVSQQLVEEHSIFLNSIGENRDIALKRVKSSTDKFEQKFRYSCLLLVHMTGMILKAIRTETDTAIADIDDTRLDNLADIKVYKKSVQQVQDKAMQEFDDTLESGHAELKDHVKSVDKIIKDQVEGMHVSINELKYQTEVFGNKLMKEFTECRENMLDDLHSEIPHITEQVRNDIGKIISKEVHRHIENKFSEVLHHYKKKMSGKLMDVLHPVMLDQVEIFKSETMKVIGEIRKEQAKARNHANRAQDAVDMINRQDTTSDIEALQQEVVMLKDMVAKLTRTLNIR